MKSQKVAIVCEKNVTLLNINQDVSEIYMRDERIVFNVLFDNTGKYFCYCSKEGTFLLNLQNDDKIELSSINKFRKICFSPNGTYVCLFSPSNGEEDNISCFTTSDGNLVSTFKCPNLKHWVLQWISDESIFMRVQKNGIVLYKTENMADHFGKIDLKEVESASLISCDGKYLIAVHIRGLKGLPHMVKVFEQANLSTAINSRSITYDKCNVNPDFVDLLWAPSGRGLLVHVHKDRSILAKTGNYGGSSLHFVSPSVAGESCYVHMPRSRKGDMHEVAWQPGNGDRFVVSYGNPVSVAVFDVACRLVQVIDAGVRNVCSFSGCGAMVALAADEAVDKCPLQLWHLGSNELVREIDVGQSSKVLWSGDDRYLCTAAVAPAARSINGPALWTAEGRLIASGASLRDHPASILRVLWQPSLDVAGLDHRHCDRSSSSSSFSDRSIKAIICNVAVCRETAPPNQSKKKKKTNKEKSDRK